MKDYYSIPKGYLLDPFKFLYQDNDVPISNDPAVQDIVQSIIDIDEERLDQDLPYLEFQVRRNNLAYVQTGCIYAKIKFKKLYKHSYSNFGQYSVDVLGRAADTIDNYIEAARVTIELIKAGLDYEDLPKNMSQAVLLKQYTEGELVEKWQEVCAELAPHERTVTKIANLLNPPVVTEKTTNTTITLPLPTYNRLIEAAYHAKLSIPKALNAVLFILTEKFKKSDIYRLLRWQLDLMDLIEKNTQSTA